MGFGRRTEAMTGDDFIAKDDSVAATFKKVLGLFDFRVAIVVEPLGKLISFRLALRIAEVTEQYFVINDSATVGGEDHVG